MNNFREVSYGVIKNKLLFRSSALRSLKEKEKKFLVKDCNIKTIIDLRAVEEREQEKDVDIKGIDNISIPLLAPGDNETKTVVVCNMGLPDMEEIYSKLVNINKKEAWTKIFNILLNNDGGILFHCTSGKDRTGVVIAVILKALGVSDRIIYKDYLLTNGQLPLEGSLYDFAMSLTEDVRKAFLDHFSARKNYLKAVFTQINLDYGSFEHFLAICCSLNEEKLNRLKNKYLMQ